MQTKLAITEIEADSVLIACDGCNLRFKSVVGRSKKKNQTKKHLSPFVIFRTTGCERGILFFVEPIMFEKRTLRSPDWTEKLSNG